MFKTISIDHLENVVGGCGAPQAQMQQPDQGAGGPAPAGGPEGGQADAQPQERPLARIAKRLPEIISTISNVIGQVRQARQGGGTQGPQTAQA